MIKISGIDHIVLRTNQIRAMINFYVDILGCVIEKTQPEIHLTQLRNVHEITWTSGAHIACRFEHAFFEKNARIVELCKRFFSKKQVQRCMQDEMPDVQVISCTLLRAGKNIIDLLEVSETPYVQNTNLEHICLKIESKNYEELKTYFDSHKINIYRFGNRYGAQGYGDSFYLRDPQGNEIELALS